MSNDDPLNPFKKIPEAHPNAPNPFEDPPYGWEEMEQPPQSTDPLGPGWGKAPKENPPPNFVPPTLTRHRGIHNLTNPNNVNAAVRANAASAKQKLNNQELINAGLEPYLNETPSGRLFPVLPPMENKSPWYKKLARATLGAAGKTRNRIRNVGSKAGNMFRRLFTRKSNATLQGELREKQRQAEINAAGNRLTGGSRRRHRGGSRRRHR